MPKKAFTKKLLIVSSWAPPAPGASPAYLRNLFSCFDPATFSIFTSSPWGMAADSEEKLPCQYFAFDPTETTGFIRSVRNGLRVIRDENIGVLLGVADRGYALALTFALSFVSGKPYALYLLDLYRWNRLGSWESFFASLFEPILFKYASTIIVMGDGHRNLYRRKYGSRFTYTVIRNCLAPEAIPKEANGVSAPPYRILYTGGVYWAQEQSLRNLIDAVAHMPDMDIRIDIYSNRMPERMRAEYAANPQVSFLSVPHRAMERIQATADILFLPLAWHTPACEVIEMAVPGKTTEYLASGRPILVHAPPYAFLSTYAKEKEFAAVVDEESIGKLQAAIRTLLTNATYRTKLVTNARKLFMDEYDPIENANHFYADIEKINIKPSGR